jgi:hypothetical protein
MRKFNVKIKYRNSRTTDVRVKYVAAFNPLIFVPTYLFVLFYGSLIIFLSFLSGGKAMDESGANLLDLTPERIHQKSPCFMGSPDDMDELKKYLTALKKGRNLVDRFLN